VGNSEGPVFGPALLLSATVRPVDDDDSPASRDLGWRIVAAIGEIAARELLDVLTRSDADRAALIGRLSLRDDATWLAELLIEIESDPDDLMRLELIGALQAALT
jgi:hypothetical protein